MDEFGKIDNHKFNGGKVFEIYKALPRFRSRLNKILYSYSLFKKKLIIFFSSYLFFWMSGKNFFFCLLTIKKS